MDLISRTIIILMVSSMLSACGGSSADPNNNGNTGSQINSISLRWDTPSTKANGDALPLSEIGGYKIYLTTNASSIPAVAYVDITDVSTNTYVLNNLAAATYYLYITTYDTNGDESLFSDPVTQTIM